MDDLPSFSGPLTAVAIDLWLNECYSKLLEYNQDKVIADRLNELDLVQKAGQKISHQGITQALADWFDSTRDFYSWNDFKVRLKEQALGSNWLAYAVKALFTTRQEDKDTDAYLHDLDELYSVIQNSIKENRGDKARGLKSINGDVLKYIMLFNAKPAVTAEIMQSGLDIVAANVSEVRERLKNSFSLAQPATSTSNDSGASSSYNPEGDLSNEKGGEGTKETQTNIPGDEDLSQPTPKIAPIARRWVVGPCLTGHTGSVTHIAFSPVGEIVASASFDGTVKIWDLATGWTRRTIFLGDVVQDVTFSPDGKMMACAAGNDVLVGGVPEGTSRVFRGSTRVYAVSFSPDSKLLAVSQDTSVHLWDVTPSGRASVVLPGNSRSVMGVAFSPNGELLMSITEYSATVWDIATGNARQTISDTNTAYFSRVRATSSLDRTLFAFTHVYSTKIVNPATKTIREFPENPRQVYGVAISPDSKYIAITFDSDDIKIRDMQTGEIYCTIRHDFQSVIKPAYRDIEFSPDGKMLAVVDRHTYPPRVVIFKGVEEDGKVS